MTLQNLQHFACLIRPRGPTLMLGNFCFKPSKNGSSWQTEKQQLTLEDRIFDSESLESDSGQITHIYLVSTTKREPLETDSRFGSR